MNQAESDTATRLCVKTGRPGVSDAMEFAASAVYSMDRGVRDAAILAATEFAENVAKYGAPGDDETAGCISITCEAGSLRITMKNRVAHRTDAERVLSLIAETNAPGTTPQELYRARLGELFASAGTGRAQLGLLRLAFEGKFVLSASQESGVLTVVAERAVATA